MIEWGRAAALFLGLGLSAAFAARSALQATFVAGIEARLYRRVVDSVLAGDVLRPSVVPDEDARAGVFEGMHRSARGLVEVLPNLTANALSALLLGIWVTISEPPRLALIAAAALACGALLVAVARRWVARAQERAWHAWIFVADAVVDAIDGRLDLVSGGREDQFKRRFGALTDEWRRDRNRAARVAAASGRTPLLALAAGVAVAVLVDAQARHVPWSEMIGQAALLASYAPAFVGIAQGFPELLASGPRLRLLGEILATSQSVALPSRKPSAVPRVVEWSNVRFSYGPRDGSPAREVLRDLSFAWRRGELLALAGPNGSGKTTCVRTLLGLSSPADGAVLADGIPLAQLDMVEWRRSIAYLPQRPYLAPRVTVRECLSFIDEVPDDAMRECLRRVGLWESLRDLSTDPLTLRVATLSVGQRQRVALARVFARNAPLMVLDEPDANLDRAGTRMLAGVLADARPDRMILLVAHSQELLAVADRVITLAEGRVSSDSHGSQFAGLARL